MAYSQIEYTSLTSAIAQGITTVKYGDKEITYRSLSEMLRIKSDMEVELGIKPGGIRRTYISHTKGLK
ncbi:MAG: hypothetical protein ABIN48_07165 [Ginsengibacter sp.]